jgi:hypothetical protein
MRSSLLFPALAAVLSIGSAANAEPFFGGTRMSSFGYRRVSAASFETAMFVPQPFRSRSAAESESEEAEPERNQEPEIESTGARPTVAGNRAVLRRGIAYAPANAPEAVKRAIWAVNTLRKKPYKWGGGHGSFQDSGYDCSGTVSFALHHAGVLNRPMASRGFVTYGSRGRGRWITVYARKGHTFAVVAGLRLDTTGFYEKDGPRWRSDSRHPGGFTARHPAGL